MSDDRANLPPAAVEPGTAIGPYLIAGIVADGASGTVYEAVHTPTGRHVALRRLPDRLAHDSDGLERFLVAAGRGLHHPNVVVADGVERDGDQLYLVMEFVGGRPAGTGGRNPWRVASRIVRDGARGLAAIHNAGLIHGQIKPAHLIIAHDGAVKLTDLGIAGLDETPVNPECAAPELVRGHPPDARTDLYALGATYFTLLTDRPPFADAGNPIDVYDAILHRPVPTVRTGVPDTPLRCDTIVQKAMAKNPAARYPSAEQFLGDLDLLLAADEPPRPNMVPLAKLPKRRSAWRRPAVWLKASMVLTALIAVGWYVFGPAAPTPIRPAVNSRDAARPTVTNSIGMALVSVPAGRFLMGDTNVPDARPPHVIQISRPFLICATEVTQAQYQLVVGENPSHFTGDARPVDSVTWDEAVAFCDKLSARAGEQSAGRVYRLPTEAEWEYACRAGTGTAFSLGPTLPGTKANSRQSGFLATIDVGILPANPLGLFDVHGNVAEWCQDWYGAEYYLASNAIDPTGPPTGLRRVARGGSWDSDPTDCRSGSRASFTPDQRFTTVGFRVICVVEGEK